MLKRLEIQNIALIESVAIEFDNGLNILTGETGAGKSIIIDSINAILGDRVSKELIRTGKDRALVEAIFKVEPDKMADIFESCGIEPEDDGTLIISREFTTQGKNLCRVNGRLTTVSVLKEIGQRIIDVHGQHDNQSLLRPGSHIELLDSFGGEALCALKNKYGVLLEKYRQLKARIRKLTGDANERERRIDNIRYQIDEIEKAQLKIGEEEDLAKQKLVMSNSEKIVSSLSCAYESLYSDGTGGCASDALNQAVSAMGSVTRYDESCSDIYKRLEDLYYQMEDIVEDIRKKRDEVEFSPEQLEEVEERLDLIFKLKRKYGNSIENVLLYYDKIKNELDELEKSGETAESLTNDLLSTCRELVDIGMALHAGRVKASAILENEIGVVLGDLDMKKASFKVDISCDEQPLEQGEQHFFENGMDRVEFMISANAGEPLKPLTKIASGGEMSRIMLAIKTILANVDMIPTLIFDEIDIGISGRAAQKVGEKLSFISRSHQVICVTHLAQIACMADRHFLIEKQTVDEKTNTFVNKLTADNMKDEIARMLGGAEITTITRKLAGEMLASAGKLKKNMCG